MKKKKKGKNNTEETIPWNKTRNLRNQNGLVRRAQRQDQKSRRDPLTSDPLAVNSWQSTNGGLCLVYLALGRCSDDFSFQKARYNVQDCTVPEKLGPPKKHGFFSLITWPQSQSVHKAVSLRPEKLKKKKKKEREKIKQIITDYIFLKSSRKHFFSFFLKKGRIIFLFCLWERILHFLS